MRLLGDTRQGVPSQGQNAYQPAPIPNLRMAEGAPSQGQNTYQPGPVPLVRVAENVPFQGQIAYQPPTAPNPRSAGSGPFEGHEDYLSPAPKRKRGNVQNTPCSKKPALRASPHSRMSAPPDEPSGDLAAFQAKERVQFRKKSYDDPEKYDILNNGYSYHWNTKQRRDAYADDHTGIFTDPDAKQSSSALPTSLLENGYQPAEAPHVQVAEMDHPMSIDDITGLLEEEWDDVHAE